MKCDKCGYDDHGSGDTAHICGPVNIKKAPVTIQTVAANLRNTIAGKEKALEEYNKALNISVDPLDVGEQMAITATVEFLKLNIDELRRILADVEKCCEKATAASWATNPDRSGGQFTQDEIDNSTKWQ